MHPGFPTLWIIPLAALLGGLVGFLLHGFVFGFRLRQAEKGSFSGPPKAKTSSPPSSVRPIAPVDPPPIDPRLLAQSETAQAIHHEAMGNLPLAHEHFLKALGLFESVNDIEGVLHACELLASLHTSLNDADGAQTYWRYALSLATSAGRRAEEARLLSRLGLMAVERGDWNQAEQLLGEALHLEEGRGDKDITARLAGSMGTIEEQQGHFALAVDYWEQALRLTPEGSAFAALCSEALGRLKQGSQETFHQSSANG